LQDKDPSTNANKKTINDEENTSKENSIDRVERIISTVNQSYNIADAIRERLNEKESDFLKKKEISFSKATNAFKNFSISSLSKVDRDNPNYFDKKKGNLLENEKNVISKTLEDLKNSKKTNTLLLSLNDKEIQKLGLSKDKEKISGTVDLDYFTAFLQEKTSFTSLEKPSIKKLEESEKIEELISQISGNQTNNDAKKENNDTKKSQSNKSKNRNPEDIHDWVKEDLLNSNLEEELDTLLENEEEKQKDAKDNIIEKIQETKSPIDTTAFHDFYQLQIAFEPIWTEVPDRRIGEIGRLLYEEIVKFQNKVSGVTLQLIQVPDSIDSFDDLAAFVDEVSVIINSAISIPINSTVAAVFSNVTEEKWNDLSPEERVMIIQLAVEYKELEERLNQSLGTLEQLEQYQKELEEGLQKIADSVYSIEEKNRQSILLRRQYDEKIKNLGGIPKSSWIEDYAKPKLEQIQFQVNEILDSIQDTAQLINKPKTEIHRIKTLLEEIQQRLQEPYKFDIFAPNSFNFGLLINYRQKWEPGDFQTGDLISSIPLAAGEVRKFTKKKVSKIKRSETEIENALHSKKGEFSDIIRIESEIVKKASHKTNFTLTAGGSFSLFGLLSGNFSTGLQIDSARDSAETKKDFREAVVKAAEEYKNEHKIEITTSSEFETEETVSGEIKNPNDEITVTYLFYEIQRRFKISENIHRITPVILVANKVPKPNDIDVDWLMAHDWILRRVILDDSYLPIFDYLTEIASAEINLVVLKRDLDVQISLIRDFKSQLLIKNEDIEGAIESLNQARNLQMQLTGDDEDQEEIEAARLGVESAQITLDRLSSELRDTKANLERQTTALQKSTDRYTEEVKKHLDQHSEILRLRVHIKQNILYYMQAIWNHEPPDQRYFRLYNIPVIWFNTQGQKITFNPVTGEDLFLSPNLDDGIKYLRNRSELSRQTGGFSRVVYPVPPSSMFIKRLYEIADLDNPLGYKGNYIIFPLKKTPYVLENMMANFMEQYFDQIVLRDPDEYGNKSIDEIIEEIQSRYQQHPELFTNITIPAIRNSLLRRLTSPRLDDEEVIIPTGELFIEALPGSRSIVEPFKLHHRKIDVLKAKEELVKSKLDTRRRIARLLDKKYDDEVDKKYVIQGNKVDTVANVSGD